MVIQPTECIDRLQTFATRSRLYCERESATSIMVYSPSKQSWLVVRYSRGHLDVSRYAGMVLMYNQRYGYNNLSKPQLESICDQITGMHTQL